MTIIDKTISLKEIADMQDNFFGDIEGLNIGSEIYRANRWRAKGDNEYNSDGESLQRYFDVFAYSRKN